MCWLLHRWYVNFDFVNSFSVIYFEITPHLMQYNMEMTQSQKEAVEPRKL